MEEDVLRAGGGFCVPTHALYGPRLKRGDTFTVTYEVKGRFRRWRLRRQGWSTEWTVEHEYVPLIDLIPRVSAIRGGVSYET